MQDDKHNSDSEYADLTDKNTQPTSNVGLVGDGHHERLKLAAHEEAADKVANEHKSEPKPEEAKLEPSDSIADIKAASEDKPKEADAQAETKDSKATQSPTDPKLSVEEQSVFKTAKMFFYRNKPIFGLDIGYGSIKVMQINQSKQAKHIVGYGEAQFDPSMIKEGVIDDIDGLADVIKSLVDHKLNGRIDFERAVMSIPASRIYIRSVTLPIAAVDDLNNAVQLEVEQYTPLPLKQLYIDFSILRKTEKDVQLLVAAVPKKIADSYLELADALNLEIISLEPNLVAVSRIFAKLDRADVPTVLIDLGALSSDVIVYDNGVVTAGTVSGGGATLSSLISSKLHINHQESGFMKEQYGIGPGYKQYDILSAIKPQLEQIVQEVSRVMRYYMEHYENRKIGQIVITGGGSNLRGLDDYLTDVLRVPTRTFMPWSNLKFNEVRQLTDEERSVFITAGGLSLITPKELFS